MSSRAKREKYRYVGPTASRTAAANAAIRPSSSRSSQQQATMPVPISAGASRAVKSDAPNSRYISAVR